MIARACGGTGCGVVCCCWNESNYSLGPLLFKHAAGNSNPRVVYTSFNTLNIPAPPRHVHDYHTPGPRDYNCKGDPIPPLAERRRNAKPIIELRDRYPLNKLRETFVAPLRPYPTARPDRIGVRNFRKG